MRLGLISDHQPALAACERLALALQAEGSEVTLLCPEPPRNLSVAWLPLTPQQSAISDLLHEFDAVGVFVDADAAAELRHLHRRAASVRQLPPVPLFSGPVRPLCGDALNADLLPRLDFELLCLQGDAQHEHLQWLLQDIARAEPTAAALHSVTIGLWCLPTAPIGHSPCQERLLVVLDEPQIPPSPFSNGVLLERLAAAALESQGWQIRIQPDAALPTDPQLWPQTSLAWHYRQQHTIPANLQLGLAEDLPWALTQASACLGIGSDWLLPPMLSGKPTVLLGDYGIRTDFNGPLFFGSGLMHRLSDCLPLDRLLELPGANPAWLDSLGWAIADGPQRLLRALKPIVAAAGGCRP